ncbi:cytidine deaminase-like fold-containing protein, partial [Pseudomonas aeruginosa]
RGENRAAWARAAEIRAGKINLSPFFLVDAKIAANGKPHPNGNMADAHAEIGIIQQAYNAGKTTGADMALKVEGKAVCSYCRGDIAAAVEKAGLNSLQINEVTTGRTLYWKPGMRSLRELE